MLFLVSESDDMRTTGPLHLHVAHPRADSQEIVVGDVFRGFSAKAACKGFVQELVRSGLDQR